MPDEFIVIDQFFAKATHGGNGVVLGVGDDAAILQPNTGHHLVVSVDTMVETVHFLPDADPNALGHKLLAVNLSDMAAMGASPRWVTMSITLPMADTHWLSQFMQGFSSLADQYDVALVGGDTTKGPLSMTAQVIGEVPASAAIRRTGAMPGDLIYVTGTLGDAGLALLALQEELQLVKQDKEQVYARLDRPQARIDVGLAIRGVANAAIDLSDGLAADLSHMLDASGVGATLYVERLPLSDVVARHLTIAGGCSLPLSAGDDYELCICVSTTNQVVFEQKMREITTPCTWIGIVERHLGLRCLMDDGTDMTPVRQGYRHF